MAGKGSGYRPVDRKKFDTNWDAIFSKKSVKHSQNETEKTADRCPNTIDIEEQISSDREAD